MSQKEKLLWLINYLKNEDERYKDLVIPNNEKEMFGLYRALVNIREPKDVKEEYLIVEDEFLKEMINQKGMVKIEDTCKVNDDLYLYKGDITFLRCDAVVNAANSGMLGCFYPNHNCIDNAIHTFAGVRLRLKCNEIMNEQGFSEPTGKAKITPAYNLPSKYILHTVGPIVSGKLKKPRV